jgi:hypothetical protein
MVASVEAKSARWPDGPSCDRVLPKRSAPQSCVDLRSFSRRQQHTTVLLLLLLLLLT